MKTVFIGFSNYRFILSICILILLGILIIPIVAFTAFHLYLVSQGRTTNEQVKRKYPPHQNAFTDGFFKNFLNIFCRSASPQWKAPSKKRYNVELFEKMAYERRRIQSNGQLTKKRPKTTQNAVKRKEPKEEMKPVVKPIEIPKEQPTSSSSSSSSESISSNSPRSSVSSSSGIDPIKSDQQPLRRSLSIMSISSRYSLDNIDETEEYIVDVHGRRQRPMPPTPLESSTIHEEHVDSISVRADSYRRAHSLQSFAFDYPTKTPLRKPKQYEIAV